MEHMWDDEQAMKDWNNKEKQRMEIQIEVNKEAIKTLDVKILSIEAMRTYNGYITPFANNALNDINFIKNGLEQVIKIYKNLIDQINKENKY
ncbi:MAG: hypothetical protein QM535_16665 [Limnohabitans sp.]|nr:hypothetical protein [Limnohabitans sp.]